MTTVNRYAVEEFKHDARRTQDLNGPGVDGGASWRAEAGQKRSCKECGTEILDRPPYARYCIEHGSELAKQRRYEAKARAARAPRTCLDMRGVRNDISERSGNARYCGEHSTAQAVQHRHDARAKAARPQRKARHACVRNVRGGDQGAAFECLVLRRARHGCCCGCASWWKASSARSCCGVRGGHLRPPTICALPVSSVACRTAKARRLRAKAKTVPLAKGVRGVRDKYRGAASASPILHRARHSGGDES